MLRWQWRRWRECGSGDGGGNANDRGSGGEGADGEILVAATAATRTAASGVHWKATMAEEMSARAMIDGKGGDREEVGTRR